MNRAWILVVILALAGCQKHAADVPAPAPTPEIDPKYGHLTHAQPKLPTVKVWVGNEELITEVAHAQLEIATGMMYRTNMPENTAMIFVFNDAAQRSFYMRNCYINLSGAYMSPSGEILQIVPMKKQDETPIPSTANNVQFVLEVPEGWFARHKVEPGAVVRTERGTLLQTFFGKN